MTEELPWWLFNVRRRGPLDPIVEFDHVDLAQARRSILWDGEWEAQTSAVLSAMRERTIVPGLRILDFGCGIGRLMAHLGPCVVGTDKSATMLRHARTHLGSDAVLGVPDDVLSSKRKFDVVIAVEVLQHIPEPELTLLLPRLSTMAPRLFVWGNAALDVDSYGRIGETPVVATVETVFRVVESVTVQTARGPRYLLDARVL